MIQSVNDNSVCRAAPGFARACYWTFLPNEYNVLETKYLSQYQDIFFVLFLACMDALINFLYSSEVGLTPIVLAADSVAGERPYSSR